MAEKIFLYSVELTHGRLPELMKLADLAEPFYRWVEEVFQTTLCNDLSLSENLLTADRASITRAIEECYFYNKEQRSARPSLKKEKRPIPSLFDGVGRTYSHRKACYYFFAWLVRDAPQQRLANIIKDAKMSGYNSRQQSVRVEIQALVELIIAYRPVLKTFEWNSIREVIYDRLEGSRRSIKGHEIEALIRTALAEAIQKYYAKNQNYGIYVDIEIPEGEIRFGKETFDVSAHLIHEDSSLNTYILAPVKTRETQGGGHSHIFTRDINSAIDASKQDSLNFVIAFIIAQNWADSEQRHVAEICDLAIFINSNPNQFEFLPEKDLDSLHHFIEQVLDGAISPKRWEEIRGLLQTDK